ncbi:hypothetical protein [Streptomyces sp. AP-93]|uniref:hypothetical protein n=1 Tax=Streptomyces sp. AP-93 TaxID=2929048 RepID=UPI001FAF8031|nr:hypothetical protein [Streptomyces sp. AP-93]MCJ0870241.1 hypothetical protein [Streptomyces sp. AP-93]
MTLNLKNIPTQAGGWFKPKEAVDAAAILVEVSAWDRQRPTPNGPKDSALCTVSIFRTPEQLSSLTPEVSQGMRIEQTVLARDLETMVGSAVLVTVAQIPPTKPGANPAWVWRQVNDPATRTQVIAYAEQRDKAVEAAVTAAPTFD